MKARDRVAATAEAVAGAVDRIRDMLRTQPVLMQHDAALPSVTTAIAGGSIAGSWWGHPSGSLIYKVLDDLDDEVAWPKLVRGKVTLVHRHLWPALIAVGRSEDAWQTHGMPGEARDLLSRVKEAGFTRTDRLRESGDGRVVGRAVDQLEKRLLVMSTQVHTADGKHARELSTWQRWQQRVGLAGATLPGVAEAQRAFEAAIASWPTGERAAAPLLPWLRAP